ncbi:acyltransferase family protein [Roseateles albus]|uniref:Acyltransferase family protein n=1 Tax=Roseateles albus TaxID=2987525 RepID=A0ABT5KGZ8_9BURK|nr:acyltransferase family protein [Roseateles albus]MDC8772081.1 acyltransferase family protein [Roseateles albus]
MKPHASHGNIKYRPEIDGLRALAVLPVVLFHAGFSGFGGGYVGVDVFFVLSGYLITTIIAHDCSQDKFSIAAFYERRARRILPALFLVMAACIPFVWLWMLPTEAQSFSRSLLSVLALIPNVYFWRTTNYFAPSAEEAPLLHTWSLGVEEQFYILFPLIIWAAWRFKLRASLTFLIVLMLAVMSFGLSEWSWRTGKLSSNFFLPFTRAWELMVGSLIALWSRSDIQQRKFNLLACNMASLAGFSMLVFAIVAFDKFTPMPSAYALLPTIGTGLIILFARDRTWINRLLAHRALVVIGLISYSAYLWHQPLFAFARIRIEGGPSVVVYLALTFVSLALAYLSWRFVEVPFRNKKNITKLVLIRLSLSATVILGMVGVWSEKTDGWSGRFVDADLKLAALADVPAQGKYVQAKFFALAKDFSRDDSLKILVIGDSYAQDFVNSIYESNRLPGAEVRTFLVPKECQVYFGKSDVKANVEDRYRPTCQKLRNSMELKGRAAAANVIVLTSSWAKWSAVKLPETIEFLALNANQKLFVAGPKRVGDVVVRDLVKTPEDRRYLTAHRVRSETRQMEALLKRNSPAGTFVSMQDAICGSGESCLLFTDEKELKSFDGTHLTQAGARFAGMRLFEHSALSVLLQAR